MKSKSTLALTIDSSRPRKKSLFASIMADRSWLKMATKLPVFWDASLIYWSNYFQNFYFYHKFFKHNFVYNYSRSRWRKQCILPSPWRVIESKCYFDSWKGNNCFDSKWIISLPGSQVWTFPNKSHSTYCSQPQSSTKNTETYFTRIQRIYLGSSDALTYGSSLEKT